MAWFSSNAPSGSTRQPAVANQGTAMDGVMAPANTRDMSRQIITSFGRPTADSWAQAQNAPRNPNQDVDFSGQPPMTLADAQREYDRYVTNGSLPSVGGALAGQAGGGDDWDNKVRQAIIQGAGGRPVDPAYIEDQVQYYRQKRGSGELTGQGIPADDNYWLMRAGMAGQEFGMPQQQGGGYSLQGPNGLASFSAPGLAAPWTQEFQRPNPNDISNTDAFKFRMGQGMDAIQKSAASKGTLLTGGTLKDLTGFAQGLASTEYDKEYNRDLGEYQMNRGTFWGNQNNAYDKLSGMANAGQNAASSYANNLGNLYQQGGNVNAANTGVQNQNWTNTFADLAKIGLTAGEDWRNRQQQPQTAIPGRLPVTSRPYDPGAIGTPVKLGVQPVGW